MRLCERSKAFMAFGVAYNRAEGIWPAGGFTRLYLSARIICWSNSLDQITPTAPLNTMSKKVLLNFALLAGQVYHLDYADASIRVYVCKAESLPKNNCLRLVARLPILSGLWACDSCVSIGG